MPFSPQSSACSTLRYVASHYLSGGGADHRGVVAAASYEARARGVHSAMSMALALRLCPEAVRVPPRHGVYGQHSHAVMALLGEYTPVIEQLSIDEAFLDLTGTEDCTGLRPRSPALFRNVYATNWACPARWAWRRTNWSPRSPARAASRTAWWWSSPVRRQPFLRLSRIESLWGVGEPPGNASRAMGIETIGALARWPEDSLRGLLGDAGLHLHRAANGIDDSPVTFGTGAPLLQP